MGRACGTYGGQRGAYRVLVGKPGDGNHLKDQGIDGRIILKWICKTWDEKAWTGLIWLGIGTGDRRLWMAWDRDR